MKQRVPAQDDVVSLAVLALLVEKPCHPYEMHRLIRQRAKTFVTGLPRSLYRAVDRLEAAQLIEVKETERDAGRPERTIFRITDEGRSEFYTWLSELLSNSPIEPSLFNVAISLLPYVTPDQATTALRVRIATLDACLHTAEATLCHVGPTLPRVCLLEVEHSRALLKAEVEWLRSVVESIAAGDLAWPAASGLEIEGS
ncbi:MAG: PadR family transcriptional regulator [Fimbriimonas sp.]|nr:PadR family transcriptional regulator [Fimbriimonas sp.]